MTRLIFIRPAAADCFQDRLAGRNADVHLSTAGKIDGEPLTPMLPQHCLGMPLGPLIRSKSTRLRSVSLPWTDTDRVSLHAPRRRVG